ncbi:hypothetical protein [Pseudomonas tohonis]|uniref:hypothetical protein n=1 Tax=Pseudomonas tohonis TaxID=2725477 RepID=UPI0021D8521E|nr:hypothetical protein [Pseudomonas tohonis]UXY50564.1 hypothetical protein N9L84_16415 [Pseudomonas tohonis]
MKSLRILIAALIGLTLGACVPTTQIIPSTDGGSFVVEEDLLQFQQGLLGPPKLVGLTPGEYICVGKNSEGLFYSGPRGGLLILTEVTANQYLKTGERPIDVSNTPLTTGFNGEGGVFVPFDPNATPRFFYYLDFRYISGDSEDKLPPRPDSKINAFSGDAPAGPLLPYAPMKIRIVHPENPNTGAPPTPQDVAGVDIGLGVGRVIGMAALRQGQGKAQLSFDVEDPRLITLLRATIREQMARN